VNWNYVLCILKPKPNQYVNRLFKKITTVKAPKHHYVTMVKHNSNAWLCLYPKQHNSNACLCLYISNSSTQQPDSQATVQCALRELELLLLIGVAADQWLCWWVVGRGWPNRCTLCSSDHPKLQICLSDSSHRNAGHSCQTFQYL